MTRQITQKLDKLETQVLNGEIASFTISLYLNGLQIKPEGDAEPQEVLLMDEILTPLKVFFVGVDAIEYSSYDYTSLKSFLSTPAS